MRLAPDMTTYSIRQMAAALGVSKSQVARDAKAGMPMQDLEAARAWRLANQDLTRTAEGRIDRPAAVAGRTLLPPGPTTDPDADSDEDPLPATATDKDTAAYRAERALREAIRRQREQLELEQLRNELVISTTLRGDLFSDVLRNRLALGRLGATMLFGLTGNIDMPRKVTGSAVGFVTEVAALAETAPSTGKVTLAPKRIGGYIEFSKQAVNLLPRPATPGTSPSPARRRTTGMSPSCTCSPPTSTAAWPSAWRPAASACWPPRRPDRC